MPLDLANYEAKTRKAVKAFWTGRNAASTKQAASGKLDQGQRAAVTGGKNMDGFLSLVTDLVSGNGLKSTDIHLHRKALTLPGFFRPTKLWDMVIMDRGNLVAALEFKSQTPPRSATIATTAPRKRSAPHTISGPRTAKVPSATFRDPSSAGSSLSRMRLAHALQSAMLRRTFLPSLNSVMPVISSDITCSARSSSRNNSTLRLLLSPHRNPPSKTADLPPTLT